MQHIFINLGEHPYVFDYVLQNPEISQCLNMVTPNTTSLTRTVFPCNYDDFNTAEIQIKFEESGMDMYGYNEHANLISVSGRAIYDTWKEHL